MLGVPIRTRGSRAQQLQLHRLQGGAEEGKHFGVTLTVMWPSQPLLDGQQLYPLHCRHTTTQDGEVATLAFR